jgi:hypothetical protein
LNRYPIIKEFIKGENGAKLYDKLKIAYVPGHNPDLLIKYPIKRIDLTVYKSMDDLHKLMIEYGFRIKDAEKKNEMCIIWIQKGYCNLYKKYIKQECPKLCARNEL